MRYFELASSSGCYRAAAAAAAAAYSQTLTLMPQQEVADQIAPGWLAAEAAERQGGLQRSGSASRLNAQAPEFVPRVSAMAAPPPPPPSVIRVFAAHPPPRAAFFAAPPPLPPPPPPFEFYAPVRGGGGGFAAEEPEPEVERTVPAAADPAVDGLADEVVHKITKQVGVAFLVEAIRSNINISIVGIRKLLGI